MAKTYEAMQKDGGSSESGWRFLDLKNRKQIGDLEKKILFYKQKNDFKVFNFTSSRSGEGVSTVLANLLNYFKLQKSDKDILVIDANFQSPSLHNVFNIANVQGLIDILKKGTSLAEVSTPIDSTKISILTSGKGYAGQSDDIDKDNLDNTLAEAKEKFDYIFIDSPPILASSNAVSTAVVSDITFWVIQALKVQIEVALRAKATLEDNECVIGGAILNRTLQVIPSWVYKIF